MTEPSLPAIALADLVAPVWFLVCWVGYTLLRRSRARPAEPDAAHARLPAPLDELHAGARATAWSTPRSSAI